MDDVLKQLNEAFDEVIANADKRTLGEKLIEKREAEGLKKVDIARITGLSESLIGKLENDRLEDITISTMKRLVMAYDIAPNVFITHLGRDEEIAEIPKRVLTVKMAKEALKNPGGTPLVLHGRVSFPSGTGKLTESKEKELKKDKKTLVIRPSSSKPKNKK